MKIFIKKYWGFDPIYWPIVAFSTVNSLDKLLAGSEPGDLMAFVGTKGEETSHDERGRLLGLAEFGRKPIHSRQALPPQTFEEAEKSPNGDIKWPHAVLITRAWIFTDSPRPMMTEVLGRQLPMSSIKEAILLSPAEQSRILSLRHKEFDVGITEAICRERNEIADMVGNGGTMGPVPSEFLVAMHRNPHREAATYAYKFGNRNVWKIGWAHNPSERLDELNAHVPSEVLNEKWGGGWIQKWASAEQAYAMEQKVLNSFPDSIKYGERVHCADEELQNAWIMARRG